MTDTTSINDYLYSYKGKLYPHYLKHGGMSEYVRPIAKKFCKGFGYDIGCGQWPLNGAKPVDIKKGKDAMSLWHDEQDYIFSSHCLEHLEDPIGALKYWKTFLKEDGVLFLYLPHPDMEYWRPENCEKHLNIWQPRVIAKIVEDVGFKNVIYSDRDLAWGFSVAGFNS